MMCSDRRGLVAVARASVSALVALCAAALPSCAYGISLEQFEQSVEVRCPIGEPCSRSLRSPLTLGGYTGVLVQGDPELSADLKVNKREFRVHVANSSFGSIILTWDGDRHPDLLSGSGLRCLDLTSSEASAIVLKNFSLHGACVSEGGDTCPPFQIETRLYDASDPTGQLYSASVLKRSSDRPAEDLAIPFSNFIRRGPRGPGRVTCVGAISLQIKFERFSDVILEVGSVYTNSLVPLEVVKQLRAPEEDVVTLSAAQDEGAESEPVFTPPPLPANVVPVPPVEPKVESVPLSEAAPQEVANQGGIEQVTAPESAEFELPDPTPTVRMTPRPAVVEPDEVIFGEVVRR